MTYTPPEKIKDLAREEQNNIRRDAALLLPPLVALAFTVSDTFGIWGAIVIPILVGIISVSLAYYLEE